MLKNQKLAILSPAFPPVSNGLGDYSVRIASALQERISISFVGTAQYPKPKLDDYYEIEKNAYSLTEFVQSNDINHLLINYSNYGYQKKGTPLWLSDALRTLRRTENVNVITFFHEIYASGKAWQSSFWLHPFQKGIFRQIYNFSDFTLCSNERVERLISKQVSDYGAKNLNIGLFSNIPEPENSPHWQNRKNCVVIFGSTGRRNSIYSNVNLLNAWIQQNEITELWDIGPGFPVFQKDQLSCPVEIFGELKSEVVSDLMQQARFGLIDYPDSLLGKSGIFAAYAAHGIAVSNFNQSIEIPMDGLEPGRHFGKNAEKITDPLTTAKNLNEWYAKHRFEIHVNKIWQLISGVKMEEPSIVDQP